MTVAFEELLSAADAETMCMVRQMVGKKEWALFVAKTIADRIGTNLDPDAVAEIFSISKQSAYNKIAKLGTLEIKNRVRTG